MNWSYTLTSWIINERQINANAKCYIITVGEWSDLNLHTENSPQSWEPRLQTARPSFVQHPAKTNLTRLKMSKTRHGHSHQWASSQYQLESWVDCGLRTRSNWDQITSTSTSGTVSVSCVGSGKRTHLSNRMKWKNKWDSLGCGCLSSSWIGTTGRTSKWAGQPMITDH